MLRMGKQKEEPITNTPPAPTEAMNQPRPAYGNDSYRPAAETPAAATAAPITPTPSAGTSAATSRAVTESETIARDIKDGNLSGFVGSGTSVTGEATFKMMLRVDGHISGRISSEDGTLIVSAGGQVDANIEVSVALINGTVNGDIVATKRIEIGRVGKVLGNIQAPALIIESGAIFEGTCRMTQAKAAEKQPVNQMSTSQPTVTNGSNGAVKKPEVAQAATEAVS